MKIPSFHPVPPNQAGFRNIRGTTLVEMITVLGLFVLLLSGMFMVFIFGQRYDAFVESKIGATDLARTACEKILRDIHGCKGMLIGTNYGGTNFVATPVGSAQVGTALQLTFNTNWSTNIIEYYYDQTNQCLDRSTSGISGHLTIANYITNTFRFTGQSYTNGGLSTITSQIAQDNEPMIDVFMEFYQFQYPLTTIASNQLYDYYKLEFTATSRNYD